MSVTKHPKELCAVLNDHGLSTTVKSTVQSAFETLKSHISPFLLIDFDVDNAVPFLKKVITTFYDPSPYIIAIDCYPCSLAHADVLNLGADICIESPLDTGEILAVINAVLRRADRLARLKPIHFALEVKHEGLVIDPMRRSVHIDSRAVTLTAKEFDILHFLASYPGVVFSKEQIYEQVWNEECLYVPTNISDHISAIRHKLGLTPKEGRYIQTVYGVGYRFVESQ